MARGLLIRLIVSTLLAALTMLPLVASATRCFEGWNNVFPPEGKSMPLNPEIVVHGDGAYGLEAITTSGANLVDTDGNAIPLHIASSNEGAGEFEVVLRPNTNLEPNTQYTLYLPDEYGKLVLARTFFPGGEDGHVWVTGSSIDTTAPSWSSAPIAGEGTTEVMGFGHLVYGQVAVATSDDGPVSYQVVLRTADGSDEQTFRVFERPGGFIYVGRGVCGGLFDMVPGATYTMHLTAVDAAGNTSPRPDSEWLESTIPGSGP